MIKIKSKIKEIKRTKIKKLIILIIKIIKLIMEHLGVVKKLRTERQVLLINLYYHYLTFPMIQNQKNQTKKKKGHLINI